MKLSHQQGLQLFPAFPTLRRDPALAQCCRRNRSRHHLPVIKLGYQRPLEGRLSYRRSLEADRPLSAPFLPLSLVPPSRSNGSALPVPEIRHCRDSWRSPGFAARIISVLTAQPPCLGRARTYRPAEAQMLGKTPQFVHVRTMNSRPAAPAVSVAGHPVRRKSTNR